MKALTRIALTLCLLFSLNVQAAQVTFQFDPPTDKTGIVGYFYGCGPTAGNNGTPTKLPGANSNTFTINLAPGTWYCAVWSYGTPDTLISAKSNEPQVPVPLSKPDNLRFTITLVWDENLGRYVAKAGKVNVIE